MEIIKCKTALLVVYMSWVFHMLTVYLKNINSKIYFTARVTNSQEVKCPRCGTPIMLLGKIRL